MTEHALSGLPWDPSPGAETGSPAGAVHDRPTPDNPLIQSTAPGEASGASPAPGNPRRRRRRRGGARHRRPGEAGGALAPPAPADSESPEGFSDGEDPEPGTTIAGAAERLSGAPPSGGRRRRRRRRRRNPQGPGFAERVPAAEPETGGEDPIEGEESSAQGPSSEEASSPGAPQGRVQAEPGTEREGGPRKRRRRSRRGRRGGRSADGSAQSPSGEQRRAPDAAQGQRGERHERRGRTGRGRGPSGPLAVETIPGEEDELEAEAREGKRESEEASERSSSAALGGEPGDNGLEPPPRRRGPKNVILVNAADREETRVAMVVNGAIVEFQMTVKRHKSLVNDIYRGRVVNLEPAIGAAFVDFGEGRNGFLHTSDVLSAYGEEDWKLEKLLTTKIDGEEWEEGSGAGDGQADASVPSPAAEEASEPGEAAPPESEEAPLAREAAPVAREEAPSRKPHAARDRARGGRPRARPRLPISDLLEKGDPVVVQVTKDAIGDKGPTLTTYISIPGRYLVLMPSMSRTGVSRKIEDEKERRRLKRILESLDVPAGMGVIVRTAGIGCTRADLKRDLDYLMLLWESFSQRLTLGRGPVELYEESDVAIRTIRDLFSDDTEEVIVDDERVYKRVLDFVGKLMPENLGKVRLHAGPRPLFHTHNVEQDFERIFARRIDLASGGSIVLDQTEALVAIDVNSGKTRSDGFDFEEIAFRTNKDAVPEIARQIRLRDLGGIVVIDFIDMLKGAHRKTVERLLRDALAQDRARYKLGRISQFGLLELTRQRLGPGMSKMLFQNCPRCRGSGRLRTLESRSEAILRRLGSALTLKGFTKVEVRAAPEVIDHLRASYGQALRDLETRHEREIALLQAPEQVEDSVLRYLRADGREVRPGGRRKR